MKIGELAKVAKCTTETIRFYEKAGLLPETARTESNYRQYGAIHVARLRFIRNCRALDMTLDEVKALLAFMDTPVESCKAVNRLLDEHIYHVHVRIEELQQLKTQLEDIRQRCRNNKPSDECNIISELMQMETEGRNERHTHLG